MTTTKIGVITSMVRALDRFDHPVHIEDTPTVDERNIELLTLIWSGEANVC